MSALPNLLTQGPDCCLSLAPLQRRVIHWPHSTLPERVSRTYSAALAVGRGLTGTDSMRLGGPPRMLRPACSLPAPGGALLSRPRPRSGWDLNLRRAAAGSIDFSAGNGEVGRHRKVPSARTACPLGAEARPHCSRAAGD